MKKIELKSRKLLRKVFNGISLTAVAFIFQACYGPGPDMSYDVKFTGTVTAKTTSLPIKGIKVTANDDGYNFGITDEDGKFDFYLQVPKDDCSYSVIVNFLDIDGIENGYFDDKTITVRPACKDEVIINVELEEKQ